MSYRITTDTPMAERLDARRVLLERGAALEDDPDQCGTNGLPCGVFDFCIEQGFWETDA